MNEDDAPFIFKLFVTQVVLRRRISINLVSEKNEFKSQSTE